MDLKLPVLLPAILLFVSIFSQADDEDSVLPEPVSAKNFESLMKQSPFNRSVQVSKNLVLTGVAEINGSRVATLIDRETGEARVVSVSGDSAGWQLVELRGQPSDLEAMTAKIKVGGGEIVQVRYEKLPVQKIRSRRAAMTRPVSSTNLSEGQMKEVHYAARNIKRGFSGDGYRDSPPKEVLEKLSRISVEQREGIIKRMMDLRNKGVRGDERQKIYNKLLDDASNGKR